RDEGMRISVSMIARNEERNIGRALASCSFADEIVVVDGGSADRTVEILRQDPRVVVAAVPWTGHFGDQRQRSLERCAGDWVIRLDADEAFSDAFERGIRAFLEGLPQDVGACTIRQCNLVGNESFYARAYDDYEATPRIWRNRPGIRWEKQVHETLAGLEGRIVPIDAYVVHYGFLDRARYAEKGESYAGIPGSGFARREDLVYREYDVQPRPAPAAVGSHVPPYAPPGGEGKKGRPRVAIVRGPNLNPWEMQNYEPLAETFDLTAYTTTEPAFDISGVRLPVVRLPAHPDHPAYMKGLEYALFDEDLVYSADTTWMFSYQAAKIREKFGKKLVCLQWENIPFAYEEREEMKALKGAVRSAADHFVAVTERAREALLLEGVDPGRITVIPMGIDTEWFRPDEGLRESCRAELGIAAGEIVVLFTGRMVWEKGVYDFVHAAKLVDVLPGSRSVRYLMVGKGPEREAVTARAEEIGLGSSFHFVESHPYGRMRDLYNAADLFVLPSISMRMWKEQFGMVLAEAMACGAPVISTLSGSIPEVVGDAGLLVPSNDPGELARAIASLCFSGDLRKMLGRKGRERAVARFDSRVVAKQVAELFDRVLKEPGKAVVRESAPGVVLSRAHAASASPEKTAPAPSPEPPAAPDRSYYRQARKEIEEMVPAGAARILDVGCGEGVLGRALLEKGASEVVGIEADPSSAEAARRNLTRVLEGDVETMELPFADGRFDCIVLADVLEHLRDPLSALKKLKRCLAEEGAVVASIPNVRFLNVVGALADGCWEYRDFGILDRTHLRFFTRKEMERLFRDAGFELEGVSENLSPGYEALPPGHAGDVSFGRVVLRGQTPEEVKDLFVFQYLFRARKAEAGARSTGARVEAAVAAGDLAGARAALDAHLLEHPLDLDALVARSELSSRLGMDEEALEDLGKVLLFAPSREDALRQKAAIEAARSAGV
ncbi:MAG: glycosyltransferase, partial [Thermodesulfobacteriota bacterium]